MDETEQLIRSLDADFQPHAIRLINALRRAGVPAVVISGRRSTTTNREVGGATRSQHLFGVAIDIQILGWRRDDLPFWWWEIIGGFWERMGGRWGGRFNPPDVNHFDSGIDVA